MSGQGATKTVTFNQESLGAGDYKTVKAECGRTETVNVIVYTVALNSVTFGGFCKYPMTKDSAAQWEPSQGIFGNGSHAVAVPDKAWVADPPLSDPVCYSIGASGIDFTTTVELGVEPALGETIPVTLKGLRGGIQIFSATGELSSGLVNFGPMPSAEEITDTIGQHQLALTWNLTFGDGSTVSLGSSSNLALCTYGNPGSPHISAKAIDYLTSQGSNLVNIADEYAYKVDDQTSFGVSNIPYYWAILDLPKKQYQLECAEGRNAVLTYLHSHPMGR